MNIQKSPQTVLAFAEQQMNAGQYPAALATLESVVSVSFNTNLTAAREFLRGRCLLELKEPVKALPLLASAVSTQKSNANFRIAYGAALHLVGDLDGAEKQYREAMRLVPTAENPPFNLARILVTKGDMPGAMRAYQQAIARNPKFALAHAAIGDTMLLSGDLAKAKASLDLALQLDPKCSLALNGKGKLAERISAFAEALDFYTKAAQIDQGFADAFFNAARMQAQLGNLEEARLNFEKAIALEPKNEKFLFVFNSFFSQDQALTKAGEARIPDAFVTELFDQYAPTFDQNLLGDLKYQTPTRIQEQLLPWLTERTNNNKTLNAIDLGAGTGLMGPLLSNYCRELTGVDLSTKMLEKASGRGYTKLVAGEIGAYLRDVADASIDLVVSSDVFVYFGDLTNTFHEVVRVLSPGGMFAFSLETLDANANPDNANFLLKPSGRYTHLDGHVQQLLTESGLTLWSHQQCVIRLEVGREVQGMIYCAQKH